LTEQEPSFVAAFGPSSESLERGEQQARDFYREGTELELSDTQRQGVGGGRFPDMQGVAELFALALGKHADVAAEIGALRQMWDRLIRLDQALGGSVWAGELMWFGGESGELITGAAAQGTSLGVLKDANGRRDGTALPAEQRGVIACAFSEANRIDDE